MRVGFDVDGVLADFNAAYIQRCIDVTGRDLFPSRPFNISTWNYPESYGYTENEVGAVWVSIKRDRTFWVSLHPYNSDIAHIENRLSAHDVYFITSRPGIAAKFQTECWLRALGIAYPTVLISSEKGACAAALDLTHYLDDRTENCLDVVSKSPTTRCYMLAQPWNTEVEGVARIATFYDFIDAFLR